ncbi:hypothetical protein B296_00016423 [Ensete ventricosum]|uniref:Uncharacterized protein n=1 Tax=Ensete ventricosum TaxID=4639 RepID=A0A427B0F6_ENSVE|nr:hypothetical protein B296_00016423 [Ensete ventricosum]
MGLCNSNPRDRNIGILENLLPLLEQTQKKQLGHQIRSPTRSNLPNSPTSATKRHMSEPAVLAFLSLTQQVQTLTDIMQAITPLLPQLTQSVTPMQQLALEPQTTPLLHEVQPISLCLTFQGSPQSRRTRDPTLHLLTVELDKVQRSPHDGPDELFPGIAGASTMGRDGSSVPLLWHVVSFSTTLSRTSRASARSPLLTGEPDPSLSNLARPPSPRQCPLEPLLDLHCSQGSKLQ